MSLRSIFRHLLTGALLGAAHLAAAQAPGAPLNTKIKVYLVGTFHFNASSSDVIKGTKVDMSTPEKQRELEELVARLQKTQADKVFVEWDADRQHFVDSTYARYRRGQRRIGTERQTNNEVVQVGYRLANALNRSRVYCADADGEFDYPAAQAYAKQHGQEAVIESALATTVPADTLGRRIDARLAAIRARRGPAPKRANNTLLEQFQNLNTQRSDEGNMNSYLLWLARVGGGDNYAGADLAGGFFKRNVRIYTNLLRAVDVQHDKVMVLIIGQGHVAFLKSILQYNSLFEVAEVLPLLEAN